MNASSESNIDPDSIKATLSYEKAFVFGPARGMILRSDALGISLKYQYGSLPPAFKLVNRSASVGLTFKLKQANK